MRRKEERAGRESRGDQQPGTENCWLSLGDRLLIPLPHHYSGKNRRRLGDPGELEVLELFAGAHWSRRAGMGPCLPPGVSCAEKIGFLAEQPDRAFSPGWLVVGGGGAKGWGRFRARRWRAAVRFRLGGEGRGSEGACPSPPRAPNHCLRGLSWGNARQDHPMPRRLGLDARTTHHSPPFLSSIFIQPLILLNLNFDANE